MTESYRSIGTSGSGLYKVKGSKHFGYAYRVKDETEINSFLENLRKEHHGARHVCYAWRLGIDPMRHRSNDDGEPSNSAGPPILGQIEKYELTNVLVAVVRYFGGTKLGVGGLIDAYRTAASLALDNAEIIEHRLMAHFRISFGYHRMAAVMLALRTNGWADSEQDFRESCSLNIAIEPEKELEMRDMFAGFTDIRVVHLGTH